MESLDAQERADRKNYYGPKINYLRTNKEKFENLRMYSFKIPANVVQWNLGFTEADAFAGMKKKLWWHVFFSFHVEISTLPGEVLSTSRISH